MSLAANAIGGIAIAGQSSPPSPATSTRPGKRTIVSRPDVIDQPEPR